MRSLRYPVGLLIVLLLILLAGCRQMPSVTIPTKVLPGPGTNQTTTTVPPGSCSIPTIIPSTPVKPSNTSVPTPSLTPTASAVPTSMPAQATLKVSFLDVGQADCTIIQAGSMTMLIDAGGNATAASLVSRIKGLGISQFDVVIGTHPHEDHIGGLDAVINNFNIYSTRQRK
jgi:competence protein ComEC